MIALQSDVEKMKSTIANVTPDIRDYKKVLWSTHHWNCWVVLNMTYDWKDFKIKNVYI